jgi:hypothetical protein
VPIESRRQFAPAQPAREQRAQAADDRRHQQRRRQALARDVADDHCETPVVEVDHVVEVAPDGSGGPHPGVDDDVVPSEDLAWNHVELDLARGLEVALHLRSQTEHLGEHDQDRAGEEDPAVDRRRALERDARDRDPARDPLRQPRCQDREDQLAQDEHEADVSDARGVARDERVLVLERAEDGAQQTEHDEHRRQPRDRQGQRGPAEVGARHALDLELSPRP